VDEVARLAVLDANRPEPYSAIEAVGRLHLLGASIDWNAVLGERQAELSLPI
jgi:acyl transferase domain-containing protein